MLSKTDCTKIMEKLSNTYGYLDKKEDKEKKNILKAYFTELKDYNCKDILEAIETLSKTSIYVPTVAEIKTTVVVNQNSFSNCNLNSSYWYTNLKYFCDRDGTPYYDITKGPDYPLPPFKN